jgi:hypothetical protein
MTRVALSPVSGLKWTQAFLRRLAAVLLLDISLTLLVLALITQH